MEKHPDDKKPVVEYTAKITLPNGEVIEKTVSTVGTFPSLEDFELSREYLDASSKKNRKRK